MDASRNYPTKRSKPERKRPKQNDITYLCNLIWNRWSYKKKKQTRKQKTETDHGQEQQTWGLEVGERGGSGVNGHFGGFLDANRYIWNGWAKGSYRTAQGNVCDWVTWLYSGTWQNTVNQLYFNNRKKKDNSKHHFFYAFLLAGEQVQ